MSDVFEAWENRARADLDFSRSFKPQSAKAAAGRANRAKAIGPRVRENYAGTPAETHIPYARHKDKARERGIGWEFTPQTWWAMWEQSGKWAERGRGRQCYCMARFGDVGPYAPGNVSIITQAENLQQAKENA